MYPLITWKSFIFQQWLSFLLIVLKWNKVIFLQDSSFNKGNFLLGVKPVRHQLKGHPSKLGLDFYQVGRFAKAKFKKRSVKIKAALRLYCNWSVQFFNKKNTKRQWYNTCTVGRKLKYGFRMHLLITLAHHHVQFMKILTTSTDKVLFCSSNQ